MNCSFSYNEVKKLNYSEGTIDGRRDAIRVFLRWCAQRTLLRPAEISPCTLEAYQGWLWQYTKSDGSRLSSSTQRQRIGTLKDWFRWMTKRQIISTDPACDLRLPRMETRLPASALTSAEVQKLLRVPKTRSPLGIRDRAILEVLYASGVRRAEVCRLGLTDLDFERRTLRIRRGKGRKDRVVPMGERAIWWLRRYLAEVRPRLCLDELEETVFLAERGHPFNHDVLSHMVTAMLAASGLARKGSCHLLRHTCATHMLEGGADIRFIQQLLGHEKLETTALYTQVTITQLREVYARCHPAAHLAKGQGGP